MARVFDRRAHVARSGAAAGRAAGLPPDRRRRDARDALDRVRASRCSCSASSRCSCSTRCSGCRRCCRSTRRGSARVAPDLAFNTAASFTTNTNWQAYGGETTMSYLTQMAGLAYHNFVSAAVGIALAIAFIRGIARRESGHARQLLGGPDARVALGAAADLRRRRAGARVAGRRAEPQAVRPGAARRSADGDDDGRRRQAQTTDGDRAGDRAGAGGVAGDHQGVRHQRRRLLQRQQRAPVREPDAAHELPRDVRASSRSRRA